MRDGARFRVRCEHARLRGFGGILCIHPSQVAVANDVFAPMPEEVERARAIVDAFDRAEQAGSASITVDDAFVDYPIAEAARRVLERHELIEQFAADTGPTDRRSTMNRERLVELMREHDVSVVVGATPPNVCYLTGHVGWAQHVYQSLPCIATFTDDGSEGTDLVVPRSETPYHAACPSTAERVAGYGGRAGLLEAEPNLLLTEEEDRFEALQQSCAENRTPVDALLRLVSERGVRAGRIVVDDANVIPDLIERLSEALPDAEVVAGGGLFLMARLVKTPSEILALRRAAEVNDGALQLAMAAIGVGVTEAAIAAIWRREIAGVGAKPLWFHLGTGRRSAYVFPPGERAFEPGDLFMLDAGLVYEGVLSDMGHCGTIGEPTEQARDEFGACKTAFEEAESAVEAGVMTSEIFHRLSNGLAGSVLDAVKLPFAGHTIGYEAREFPFVLGPATPVDQPFLPPTSDVPLPAGSTINVEIPLGRLGWGGYQIEKTFVVKEGGYDTIVDQRAEMLVR